LIGISGLLFGSDIVLKTKRDSPLEFLGAAIFVLGAGCSLVMVFQGFHLWNIGWKGIPIDPDTASNLAARSRGKGGIILLILQFLPQFLVFGYGGLLWQRKNVLRYSARRLGFKS
jgi:hypothetical protein